MSITNEREAEPNSQPGYVAFASACARGHDLSVGFFHYIQQGLEDNEEGFRSAAERK